MSVSVQSEGFDVGAEMANLTKNRKDIGALVSFTGLVRDMPNGSTLELEHYPGMTQKALEGIEAEAKSRWELQACRIIHRFGALEAGAQIVLVLTASPHRQAAFEAAEFIMDYLKSRAPFWKKEAGAGWVDARDSDEAALNRWNDT
jgi:molybdopterin synthase catalytic subunit